MYGGLFVVGMVIAGGLVVAFLFRDTATPVTRDDITVDSVLVGTEMGDPGVYVYATTGGEEVDALGGGRHDYPAETFAVARTDDCGLVIRWVALEERWTEWTRCEGEVFPRIEDTMHTWFGIPEPSKWTCTPDGPVPDPAPGVTWIETCTNGESTDLGAYEVIGFETLTIGGTDVETVHLTRSATSTGRTAGETTREEWVTLEGPLLVKGIFYGRSVSSTSVGDVTYVEDYTLELQNLLPGS